MLYIPSIYIIVCCPCTAYNSNNFVFPDYGKFRCTAFSGVPHDFISLKAKTPYRGIFARLVTNSFFVIIVTLIITFYIWIVKCYHQALYRYSFGRITPCTVAVLPIFSEKKNPQHRSTSGTAPSTCQLANNYQASSNYQIVKVLTSLCFPPETHQPDNTQHGQEKIPIV